jgi:hypothetical protein
MDAVHAAYGPEVVGQSLWASVPHIYWKTTTFLAGLRLSEMVAFFVPDDPINADTFRPLPHTTGLAQSHKPKPFARTTSAA